MKKVIVSLFILISAWNAMAQNGKSKIPVKTPAQPIVKSLVDSFSYMVGYNVASNMRDQGISGLNTALMQKGFDDLYNNKPTLIPLDAGNKSFQHQLALFSKKKEEMVKMKTQEEKLKCATYLETNKKRKEVTTLPSGLQYEIIKAGDSTANKPHVTDTVVVNYIGVLMDGKEFDNSLKRGQPAVFPVNQVIRGWTEILQLMPVGSHWKVYIPAELAYGDNPPPGSPIKAGAVLIFDIILEGIKPGTINDKQ